MTIQRFARGYIARKNFRFGSEFRYKLLEMKRVRLERMKGGLGAAPASGSRQGLGSKESQLPSSAVFEKKKKKKEGATEKNDPQTELDFFRREKEFKKGCLQVIGLARKNQWVAIRSLDFVVLKTHLRETDTKGNTALYYAALNQNLQMCKFLLEKGANPNFVCENGNTPFHCAFLNGSRNVGCASPDHQPVRAVQG